MKQISLALIIVMSIFLYSCDSKKEKRTKKDSQENLDTYLEEPNDYTEEYESYTPEEVNDSILSDTSSTEMSYESTQRDSVEVIELNTETTEPETIEINTTEPNNTQVNETNNTETQSVKSTQKRYYIVAGSFNKYHNAVKLDQFFKSKGYYSMVLPKMNTYNRVAISSFEEEANARKKIMELKNQYKEIDFWLFRW